MARYNIEAHLHRFEGKNKRRTVTWIRYYHRIETAVQRGMRFLMEEGEVGDIIEFVLKINSDQRGTLQYHATGRVTVTWNDDQARRFRNKMLLEGK